MNDLEKIEDQISKARFQLAELERKAEELRAVQKESAIEEIKQKMLSLGLSISDVAGKRKTKKTTGKASGRYYQLNGKMYPVQRGRMPKELAEYKAKGGDLTDILVQSETA